MPALIQAEPKLSGVSVARGDLPTLDQLNNEAVAVFCFEDVRPLAGAAGFLDWRLCGALSHAIERGHFTAAPEEVALLPSFGRLRVRRVFAFGLGKLANMSMESLRGATRQAHTVMRKAGVKKLVLLAPVVRRKPDIETMFLKAVAQELPGDVELVLLDAERMSP